tara:strand:- start:175439 stop:176227 length:789 start_codon:yes stop_codon:yes gene_type:complete
VYYLFSDETNTDPQNDPAIKFFVYGGLIVPSENLENLHAAVAGLRSKHGYTGADTLKFNTVERPKHISREVHAEIKKEVVEAAINAGCTFVVYVILHAIAKGSGIAKTIEFGGNHIFGKFNLYLEEKGAKGIVINDRLENPGQYAQFIEKFTTGLQIEGKGEPTKLSNIILYASTCNNASHINSVADVVLGSFRYCINDPKNPEAASKMMQSVTKMIWAVKLSEDDIDPFERGLTLRPKKVNSPMYKSMHQELISHINGLLK